MAETLLNPPFTYYPSFGSLPVNARREVPRKAGAFYTLEQVHERLHSSTLRAVTREYRSKLRWDPIRTKRRKLDMFPAVAFGGRYAAYGEEYMLALSGYGQYDIDYIAPADTQAVKAELAAMPEVALVFTSPSGAVKAVLHFTPKPETAAEHRIAIGQARVEIDARLGVISDKGVTAASKLCFLSYDPMAVMKAHQPFVWEPPPEGAYMTSGGDSSLTDLERVILMDALNGMLTQLPYILRDRNLDDLPLRYCKTWGEDNLARQWYEAGRTMAQGRHTHRAQDFAYYYNRTQPFPEGTASLPTFLSVASRWGYNKEWRVN